MKAALCLHGLFDSLEDKSSKGLNGYQYIKKHILEYPGLDTDIYIHSWQPELKKSIINLYNPKDHTFENQIDFSSTAASLGLNLPINYPRPPARVLSHFYSIGQVFQLLKKHKGLSYDLVIKSRFDLGQINTSATWTPNVSHVGCINFNPSNDLSRINMAYWKDEFMTQEGPPDAWFYSNYEAMECFSTIYEEIVGYIQNDTEWKNKITTRLGKHNIINASVLYKKFFQTHGLWDNRLALKVSPDM
tara:strand:+ start:6391 stop:7128 length:738 start_codon:yes stop_codon:yes gene_type:complete